MSAQRSRSTTSRKSQKAGTESSNDDDELYFNSASLREARIDDTIDLAIRNVEFQPIDFYTLVAMLFARYVQKLPDKNPHQMVQSIFNTKIFMATNYANDIQLLKIGGNVAVVHRRGKKYSLYYSLWSDVTNVNIDDLRILMDQLLILYPDLETEAYEMGLRWDRKMPKSSKDVIAEDTMLVALAYLVQIFTGEDPVETPLPLVHGKNVDKFDHVKGTLMEMYRGNELLKLSTKYTVPPLQTKPSQA